MIDYVTELETGNFANGYKDLDENLWFLKFIGLETQICLLLFN